VDKPDRQWNVYGDNRLGFFPWGYWEHEMFIGMILLGKWDVCRDSPLEFVLLRVTGAIKCLLGSSFRDFLARLLGPWNSYRDDPLWFYL
jgi:hypothetical protein